MLFGPAGACGRCRHLPGLVGIGVAGVFRELRCALPCACGQFWGLVSMWAPVCGWACGQRCGRWWAGVLLGRRVAPRSLGSGQMTQDLIEFDRQGKGKQKEHPISLRALNKTSRIG